MSLRDTLTPTETLVALSAEAATAIAGASTSEVIVDVSDALTVRSPALASTVGPFEADVVFSMDALTCVLILFIAMTGSIAIAYAASSLTRAWIAMAEVWTVATIVAVEMAVTAIAAPALRLESVTDAIVLAAFSWPMS